MVMLPSPYRDVALLLIKVKINTIHGAHILLRHTSGKTELKVEPENAEYDSIRSFSCFGPRL